MTDEVDLELFREPAPEGEGPTAPRLMVIGGAKGGTGKSLLAANLAIYLASLGRRVVAVDADRIGANLHGFLGVPHPAGVATYTPPLPSFASPDDEDGETQETLPFDDVEDTDSDLALVVHPGPADGTNPPAPGVPGVVDTGVRGLRLLHAGLDEPARGESTRRRRRDLTERLTKMDADWIVIDIGAGLDHSLLDLWLDADVHLFATLPEPTAVEGTYRFVRATFLRRLRRLVEQAVAASDDSAIAEAGASLLERLEQEGRALPPLDLLRKLRAEGHPLADQVEQAMEEHDTFFVVNQTRLRADLELGERMASAARRRLGVRLEYLGYVDFDDTVWNCLRTGRPLLIESPGTKASRSIEKIARRLLSLAAGKYRFAPQPTVPLATHHDLLEIDRGATDEEVRRAAKRAREIYAPGSLACVGLFDETGLERLRARLEEAHDVLLDPARRRPYELSVFPPEPTQASTREEEADEGPRPPPPVITPETVFTGALLRAVRLSKGVRLKEISQKTKIGVSFLQAIEGEQVRHLPAQVYIRGFVTEVAKFLGLDPEHVSRTYVRRLEKNHPERAGAEG
ncbi:MAG: helix-turn-helix domain-containing protein [Deltaproteobacteria bacterium]|nr:helix-turn-helix domain-containing protein [Deltaproteobacteria bacterium]